MMLSHLPVERVRIYQFNFTKFRMQNFSFTKSRKFYELKFFQFQKKLFRSVLICFFFSLFVCSTNAGMQLYYLGFTY